MFDAPTDQTRMKGRALGAILLVFAAACLLHCGTAEEAEVFTQTPLPYAENALEPYISALTMHFHYKKHHAAYVADANARIADAGFSGATPEQIIAGTAGHRKHRALFNSAAQAWNHDFFWHCLKPGGDRPPMGELAKKIDAAFGSYDQFRHAFVEAATAVFGSGWIWLVADGGTLRIVSTANADTPLATGLTPLFTIDLWEHAYYLDHQNRRKEFVKSIVDHLANWEFAEARLKPETTDKSERTVDRVAKHK